MNTSQEVSTQNDAILARSFSSSIMMKVSHAGSTAATAAAPRAAIELS
jgi:hypothetical protein